jgi:hypothetical protein
LLLQNPKNTSKVVVDEHQRKAMNLIQQAHAVLNEKTALRKESGQRRLKVCFSLL